MGWVGVMGRDGTYSKGGSGASVGLWNVLGTESQDSRSASVALFCARGFGSTMGVMGVLKTHPTGASKFTASGGEGGLVSIWVGGRSKMGVGRKFESRGEGTVGSTGRKVENHPSAGGVDDVLVELKVVSTKPKSKSIAGWGISSVTNSRP